jgi:hypothetical protein
MAFEFRLDEYNYQAVPGDSMTPMDEMSAAGWDIEASQIGFPYVHVLWRREAGSEPAAAADHSECEHLQARALARLEEAERQASGLAKAHAELTAERDQAALVAQQWQQRARDLEEELARLRPGAAGGEAGP